MPQSRYSNSIYPTGQAPFSADLSEKIAAITQQMVQNRQQEIKEKNLAISDSEKDILTALDFKTLEGAGDKFTLEQAQRLADLKDKWSHRFIDASGVLSMKDKIDLLRDKRDVEAKLATGAAELKQYQEWQKELSNRNQDIYDAIPMLQNMAKYVKEGKLGTGGLINQAVLKKHPIGEQFQLRYEPFMKQRATVFQETPIVIDANSGETKINRTNKASIDAGAEYLRTTPEYADDPVAGEVGIKNLYNKYLSEPSKAAFSSSVKPKGESGVSPDKDKAISDFNSTVIGLANADQDAMNKFESTTSPVSGVEYVKDTDGKNKLVIKYRSDKIADEKIPIPENITDPETGKLTDEGKLFYQKIWDAYPKSLKQGITTIPLNKLINPDLAEKKEYKKSIPINIQQENDITELKSNIDKYDNTQKSGTDIIEVINKLIPDSAEYKKPTFGKNKVVFDGKEYIVKNKDDREKLKTDVLEKLKATESESITLKDPEKKVKLRDGSEVSAQEFINNLDENQKEEAIKRINNMK